MSYRQSPTQIAKMILGKYQTTNQNYQYLPQIKKYVKFIYLQSLQSYFPQEIIDKYLFPYFFVNFLLDYHQVKDILQNQLKFPEYKIHDIIYLLREKRVVLTNWQIKIILDKFDNFIELLNIYSENRMPHFPNIHFILYQLAKEEGIDFVPPQIMYEYYYQNLMFYEGFQNYLNLLREYGKL